MLKRFSAIILLTLLSLVSCDNHRFQSSYRFNEETRLPVEGTIAIPLEEKPFVLNKETLVKGRHLFEVNCVVCHGYDGSGNSVAVKRGLSAPDSLHEKELDSKNESYYEDMMTNGIGTMPSFRRKLSMNERKSVAAYIKALRLSRRLLYSQLDPEDQKEFP